MAVLSNGGTGPAARAATAVAQPKASDRGTSAGGSGLHPASTRARASSRAITGSSLRLPRHAVAAQELDQEPAQLGAQVGSLQGQLHRGSQVVEPFAGCVAALPQRLAVYPFPQ